MSKKMITKSLICMGIVTLMAQSTAVAQPATPTQPSTGNTGFYGGVALGATALTGDSRLTVSRIDPNFLIPESRNFMLSLSDKNLNGDLFIGYGKRINCLYLGLELIGSLSYLNSKQILDISGQAGEADETLTTETFGAWGAAAMLGFHMNPTSKLYARLGVETRQFNINFVSPALASPYLGINQNFRSTAFVPGFGLEVDITPGCTVRTEYRIALHRKSKLFQVNDPAIAARFTNVQTKPTIHYFNVGLIVKV